MFDASLLPPARTTLALVADTHQTLAGLRAMDEFPSRAKQTVRSGVALRMLAALQAEHADHVIHMGDLVQAYPGGDGFEQAVSEALATLGETGIDMKLVAGNHDVGDKADPTMPAETVTPAALEAFHARFGSSWYAFEAGAVRAVVINSQILNRDDLPESAEQRDWLERELASHADRRLFLLLHLPLYLGDADEPGLGHYDNIAEPARSWLLGLIRRYEIEQVFAGHVHWRFFDAIDQTTRYQTIPSPAFTRPGFGHAFTSAPAPEQGRDDRDKLGLVLVRVMDGHTDTHLLRTQAMETLPEPIARGEAKWLLTRTPSGLPESPLGVTLRHPLTPRTQVPLAWPSVVRQPIRNDYPLLSLIEMGARHLRVPAVDFEDAFQRDRLALARAEGMRLTAMVMDADDGAALPPWIEQHQAAIDAIELRVPGGTADEALIAAVNRVRAVTAMPLALSPVLPHEPVEGKQHMRTRLGYRLDEAVALRRTLRDADAAVDRLVLRVDANTSPWTFFQELRQTATPLGPIDVLVELATQDDAAHARRAAEAMMGAATCENVRVYFDPMIDLDRTMDVMHGLLDTRCNPRPAMHVLRMLNTILFSEPQSFEAKRDDEGGGCALVGRDKAVGLGDEGQAPLARFAGASEARVYDLIAGTVSTQPVTERGPADRATADRAPDTIAKSLALVEVPVTSIAAEHAGDAGTA